MMAHQNVKNLMLREDVVWAIRDGEFHNYSESTIDEGIEILTFHPAGERQSDGSYPEGTLNDLLDQRLGELTAICVVTTMSCSLHPPEPYFIKHVDWRPCI